MGKIFRMLLIAGLCLTGFAGAADAANLAVNGSFEDGFTGWNNWDNTFVETEVGDGVVSPVHGDSAAKAFQNFSGVDNWAGFEQMIPVEGDKTYRLSGYLRNGDGLGGDTLEAGASAFLKVAWYSPTYDWWYEQFIPAGGIDSTTTPGTWVFNSADFDSVAGVGFAQVVGIHQALPGEGTAGGASWFDDIKFEDVTVPEPGTIVMLFSGLVGLLFYGLRRRNG